MTKSISTDVNKDVLSSAIKFEEDGRNLYLECVKKTEHPWGKSLFQSLADDELKHIERLKETFETLQVSQKYTEGPLPLAAQKQWKNIFEKAKGKIDTAVKASTADIEALNLGIDFEEKGMKYYQRLSEESRNPLEKRFYQILAQEENRHFLILKDSHELLTDPASWFEKTEKIGLDGG
ncbi:MAG: ferritin family protein [Deltaproteobacteria bacterium]|nr:ferritin family protein [Deltaproteobacteria bacterium]